MILPPEAHPRLHALVFAFADPTYQRSSTLLVAAGPASGRRTAANLLRTRRHLAPGHRTTSQRVEAATGCGHWYEGGYGLAPVRWVSGRDATGAHRGEYLLTTDPAPPTRCAPAAKRVGAVSWPGKATVTFSDALGAVRRWPRAEAILPQAGADAAPMNCPRLCGNCCSPRSHRRPTPCSLRELRFSQRVEASCDLRYAA